MRRNSSRPEVVVITGASAGVGRATVREFARRGASIGLIARGEDGLKVPAKKWNGPAAEPSCCLPTSPMRRQSKQAAAEVERDVGSDRHLGE